MNKIIKEIMIGFIGFAFLYTVNVEIKTPEPIQIPETIIEYSKQIQQSNTSRR